MMVKKKRKEQYVTVERFDSAMAAIKQTFDQWEERMLTKEDGERFATKEQLARVLDIVQSIDERLKEWRTIPHDVQQLKADVFQLKMKVK